MISIAQFSKTFANIQPSAEGVFAFDFFDCRNTISSTSSLVLVVSRYPRCYLLRHLMRGRG